MASKLISRVFTDLPHASKGNNGIFYAKFIRNSFPVFPSSWSLFATAIEVFFKCAKSLLRLQKEFQGRSYDLLISIPPLSIPVIFCWLGSIDKVPINGRSVDCFIYFAMKSVPWTGRWLYSNWWN